MAWFLISLGIIALLVQGVAYIILQGWQEIPAGSEKSPPYIGVPTFLGRPQYDKEPIEPGMHFFLGFPLLWGFIPIPAGKFGDKNEIEVILPDGTPVKQSLGWTLLLDKKDPEAIRRFIESGCEAGVKGQIHEIITERGREFLSSKEKGPHKYREAQGIQEEMSWVLFRAIVDREDVSQVCLGTSGEPFPVPTSVLLKYSNVPRKSPSECEAKAWGREDPNNKEASEWEKLDKIIDKLTDEEFASLKQQIEERRKAIQETRDGRGEHKKRGLGVILCRLNIGEVMPTDPEMVKAIQKKAIEQEEKEADAIEMKFARGAIKETAMDLEVKKETAANILHIERGKITKIINATEYSASEGLLNAIPIIIEGIARAIKGNPQTQEGVKKNG